MISRCFINPNKPVIKPKRNPAKPIPHNPNKYQVFTNTAKHILQPKTPYSQTTDAVSTTSKTTTKTTSTTSKTTTKTNKTASTTKPPKPTSSPFDSNKQILKQEQQTKLKYLNSQTYLDNRQRIKKYVSFIDQPYSEWPTWNIPFNNPNFDKVIRNSVQARLMVQNYYEDNPESIPSKQQVKQMMDKDGDPYSPFTYLI